MVLVPNLSAVHYQSLDAEELLPSGHFQGFSTKPGCCPCERESFRSDHCRDLISLQGLLQLPLATLSQVPGVASQHTTAPRKRDCALENCPGQSGEPWAAATATMLRQLCKAVGSEPAPRSPAAALTPPLCLGHLLLPFCKKVINILFFLDELAQSPALYVLQKLNP